MLEHVSFANTYRLPVRYKLLIYLFLLLASSQNSALSDTKGPPPFINKVYSTNKRYYAISDPGDKTTTVYLHAESEKDKNLWFTPGWYRNIFVSNTGDNIVVGSDLGNLVTKPDDVDQVILKFIRNGNVVREVSLGDLFGGTPSLDATVSHFYWGDPIGFNKRGDFLVETVDGRTLFFNPETGRRLAPDSQSVQEEMRLREVQDQWYLRLERYTQAVSSVKSERIRPDDIIGGEESRGVERTLGRFCKESGLTENEARRLQTVVTEIRKQKEAQDEHGDSRFIKHIKHQRRKWTRKWALSLDSKKRERLSSRIDAFLADRARSRSQTVGAAIVIFVIVAFIGVYWRMRRVVRKKEPPGDCTENISEN